MTQYFTAIETIRTTTNFKSGQPKHNRETANDIYKTLMQSLKAVDGVEYSPYFHLIEGEDIKQVLDNMRFEAECQPLVFEANRMAKNGELYVLAQKGGKALVVMRDLGTMQTGWFSETDYHQLVLVFVDPDEEGHEIGFSLNVKGGLNIILFPKRFELYPSFALLSVSEKGYQPMTYHNIMGDDYARYDYFDEDGAKRSPSLWERFLSL